ncbi:NUDIX domain-containing protein [Methylobacter psychrophilus]|uniref:NUDIX domain-containing protein n=1 Tax=Methylobacter psychrophilus TaxID=96941 RepID=UPI0021D4DFA1|nr:NUDIX domain-containing protein [Methylobacter psychrophilus]
MSRALTRLAFILLHDRRSPNSYWLLDNGKLKGYNWIGGKIDPDDKSPRAAVIREFNEEIVTELSEWAKTAGYPLPDSGFDRDDSLPTLKALANDAAIELPFFSAYAKEEGLPSEKLAQVHYFTLEVMDVNGLAERLDAATLFYSPFGSPACIRVNLAGLVNMASANPANPFLGLALRTFNKLLPIPSTPVYSPNPLQLAWAIEKELSALLVPRLNEAVFLSIWPTRIEQANQTLKLGGTVRANFELRIISSEQILKLELLFPCAGVFPEVNAKGDVQVSIWHPALVHACGVWLLQRHLGKESRRFLRIAGLEGRSIDVFLDEKGAKTFNELVKNDKALKKQQQRLSIFASDGLEWESNLPDSLLPWLDKLQSALLQQNDLTVCEAFYDQVFEQQDQLAFADEMNLEHRRLLTYSRTLIMRFSCVVRNTLKEIDKKGKTNDFWTEFCIAMITKSDWITPVKRWRAHGYLQRFDPINALDGLSRMTGLSTFAYPGETLERLPPARRQLHPSYLGCICPFESPESSRIGLSVNLAWGANVDVLGGISPAPITLDYLETGYAAALVPFVRHNDAARAMMGAKNLKQAVAIKGAKLPRVRTGRENSALDALQELTKTDWMPVLSASPMAAPGRDLLVAYLPWDGWNFEDGLVASERLKNEGLFDFDRELTGHILLQIGAEHGLPIDDSHLQYDAQGCLKSGQLLIPHQVMAWVRYQDQNYPVFWTESESVELIEMQWLPAPDPLFAPCLLWKAKKLRPLGIGDKLMARHGNKGVIARFEPVGNMPRLPNDPDLPASLRGREVDLLLNPNGVISRMNIGQLIETQYAMALELADKEFAVVGQRITDEETVWMKKTFADRLPFDEFGRIHLQLPDGNQTEAPVTVGFEFFSRLKQMPIDKANARSIDLPVRRYALVHGQPVAGRDQGGGQRLGEMEIWALAAHQADSLLQDVLEKRSGQEKEQRTFAAISDYLCATGFVDTGKSKGKPTQNSQRDNPRASRFSLQHDGNKLTITRDNETFAGWLKKCKPITTSETFIYGETTAQCPKCFQTFSVPVGAAKLAERSKGGGFYYCVELASILKAKGWKISDDFNMPEFFSTEDSFIDQALNLPLADGQGELSLTMTLKKRTLKGIATLDGSSFLVSRQVNKTTSSTLTLKNILGLKRVCPKHPGELLQLPSTGKMLPAPGGIYDPAIFGGETAAHFARIDYTSMHGQRSLPVLPLRYRLRDTGKPPQREDELSKLYQALFNNRENAEKADGLVKKIYNTLNNGLFGKLGLLRRHGLGRRVDRSARLVIAPDPRLDWDACGLPIAVLLSLFGKELNIWSDWAGSVRSHIPPGLLGHEPAWVARLAESNFVLNFRFHEQFSLEMGNVLSKVLKDFLRDNPKLRVLLNRAPSLQRHSIQAFRPTVLADEDGWVLRISPLVCAAFAADFDGDEMSVHAPINEEAHEEAEKKLSPISPQNLLSVADGNPLAGFSQDFILGFYLAGRQPNTRMELTRLFPDCCQSFLSDEVWNKAVGEKLLKHLCIQHPLQIGGHVKSWLSYCLKLTGPSGVSFGWLDLLPHSQWIEVCVDLPDKLNDKLQDLADQVTKGLVSGDNQKPGWGLAVIKESGARGKAEQVRQLLIARGELDPGAVCFEKETNDTRFIHADNLVQGMSVESAFYAAMNGRSSMVDKKLSTPQAGALSRRLVLNLWAWKVQQGNCGQDTKSLEKCDWIPHSKLCRHCYGSLADGKSVPEHYPAGLIAAQSFGERGTQLSMQSFHTGGKAVSMQYVTQHLRAIEQGTLDLTEFIDKFGAASGSVYKDLDERHLKLIWIALSDGNKKERTLGELIARARANEWDIEKNKKLVFPLEDSDSPFIKLILGVWS